METYPIFCGGRFISTSQGLEVTNPYSGEVVARTWLAGSAEIDSAIRSALQSARDLKEMPAYQKYEDLMFIAGELRSRKDWLARILAAEAAKPLKLAEGELDRAIQTFVVAAEESRRLGGEVLRLDWTPPGKGKEGIVRYFPVGLVSGIAPFNFPLNLAVHKIAPALAAGCPIILKPARSTPLSTLELAKIIAQTSLPAGSVSILPCDRQAGEQLVTDPRIALLSFTGSPEVGWDMKNRAGKKKVLLELGGNAGVIVTETADIELAVRKCIAGGFSYQGQVCIHTQRIFVHRTLFEAFTAQMKEGISRLKIGDPLDPEAEFSSMIDEENAIRVEKWIQEAVGEGARVLCGGHRRGALLAPCLITMTKPEMSVCANEVFGPVVTVDPYDHFDEAIRSINQTRFGLQAGVFTRWIPEMDQAFSEIEAGGVMINEVPTFRVDHMPYGGIKDSGLGREGLSFAMKEMLEPKILVKDSFF